MTTSEEQYVIEHIENDWQTIVKSLSAPLRYFMSKSAISTKDGRLCVLCQNDAALKIVKNRQSQIKEKIKDLYNFTKEPNLEFDVSH